MSIDEHKARSFLGFPIENVMVIIYPLVLIPIIFLFVRESRRQKSKDLVPKGFTKLSLPRMTLSHLHDEKEDRYAQGDSADATPWSVKALLIHPIKSCAAIELESVAMDGAGMLWDRKFAFAELLPSQSGEEPQWTFRTLRQPGLEKMARIRPEIWLRDGKTSPKDQQADAEGFLVVKFPYLPSGPLAIVDDALLTMDLIDDEAAFCVPLVPPPNHKYPVEKVTIWKDSPKWVNYGEHIPPSFQKWLGTKNPISLFRVDPQSYRQVFRNAPKRDEVGYQPVVGFADAYPANLMNLASVRDIAERVKESIPRFTSRRFRSNIVLTGPPKYDEDDWKKIQVGEHVLHCACHTIRCRLPNVDPVTAFRHPTEPDKTLKSFRCIDEGDPLNAALGLQLVPDKDEVVELKIGDEIRVLKRGKHRYVKQ